jgi:hypothetical protein
MFARHRIAAALTTVCFLAASSSGLAQDTATLVQDGAALTFSQDPFIHGTVLIEGAAEERLTWNDDGPAFPGDRPGSLTALYDSTLEPGRFGVLLPERWNQDDTFTAAAVFVIEGEGFSADPSGFFGISWGLWNTSEPGLDRTGDFTDFAADTFEVLEWAWFPNVSLFFGGPFLSPSIFGEALPDDPSFPFLGGFTNFGFGSTEVSLPLDEPLLAVMEHLPDADALVVSVSRIVNGGRVIPVPGASAVIDLTSLPSRVYSVDALGLTLWQDGFSGATPSVDVALTYHYLLALPGEVDRLPALLHVPEPVQP